MKEKPLKKPNKNALKLRKLNAWQRRLLIRQSKRDWRPRKQQE